jgi:hypothetical protein
MAVDVAGGQRRARDCLGSSEGAATSHWTQYHGLAQRNGVLSVDYSDEAPADEWSGTGRGRAVFLAAVVFRLAPGPATSCRRASRTKKGKTQSGPEKSWRSRRRGLMRSLATTWAMPLPIRRFYELNHC